METFFIGVGAETLFYWRFGKLEYYSLYPKYVYTYIQTITALKRSNILRNLKIASNELVRSFILNDSGMLVFIDCLMIVAVAESMVIHTKSSSLDQMTVYHSRILLGWKYLQSEKCSFIIFCYSVYFCELLFLFCEIFSFYSKWYETSFDSFIHKTLRNF